MAATQAKHIVVGMSGGVDSSVAAALLVRQGFRVTGAFMKNWSDSRDPLTGACSWKEERRDAMRVAARLGIPFVTFDFEKEYREAVVGYLYKEYAAGRTPNPDVMCNKEVKFELFLRRALELGADAIATGHYARVRQNENGFELLEGLDANKDQSYFLHQLTQEQLSRTLFPIGHLEKPEVRRIATEFDLPTANKKDSQGICFIGKVDLGDFLATAIPRKEGPIVSTDGQQLGTHQGITSYTIGQRHGFAVAGDKPYFVAEKQLETNTLVVAEGEDHPALFSRTLIASDVHWIGQAPQLPHTCSARIRYRQELQECTVESADNNQIQIRFTQPQRAVSPGQFVVLHASEICLGGAVIEKSIR